MVHKVDHKDTKRQVSEVIYRQNVERNVDHLKLRIDLVEGLLVKYSIQRVVSGHSDGDNTVDRLTERHFPRRIPRTVKEMQTNKTVCCLQQA
jgi:hypothetical protein